MQKIFYPQIINLLKSRSKVFPQIRSKKMPHESPFDLTGQVAVVTGGAMGIGYGIVERLSEAGAAVLVADLDGAIASEKANNLAQSGRRVAAVQVDIASEDAGKIIVQKALEAFGRIDILVNNAGIFPQQPMLEMERGLFEKIIAINLTGLAYVSREVAEQMIQQGDGGKIVNITSIDAYHPSMVGLAAYDASKGAVRMFTRSLALELAPHHIHVNSVAPGGVTTEGTSAPLEKSGMTPEQQQQIMQSFTQKIPLKRMGVPDDIAKVVWFVASSASDYMTGAEIVVDGGVLLS